MLVGDKILFRQRERVFVLLVERESDDLACMMLNIKMDIFFFLYIQFTLVRTKNAQSPGTYISKRTWDPSQKAITK